MRRYLLIIIPVVLLAVINFLPYRSVKEPSYVKADSKTEMRKKITKILQENPGFKGQKSSSVIPPPVSEKNGIVPHEKVMAGSLIKEISRYIKEGKKNIRLVLNVKDDREEISKSIINAGGRIIRKRPGFMAAEVPADRAEQLIKENSSIRHARLPFRFYPSVKISEGVNLTGANIFHDTLNRGAGVKVAILDVGFKGLSEAITAGELPSNVITQDFSVSESGPQTEYKHGTSCAEIIHDMAPEAELHLIKLGDEIGGYEVIDYCINNNIDIVSLSIGTFGTGPGNGTGPLNEAFDELREAGILVVASAGNYANYTYEGKTYGSHWEGTFTNTTGDLYHEFLKSDPDSFYNVIEAYPEWNDDGESESGEVSILMRWNDAWPGSSIDYEMYLLEYDYDTGEFVDYEPVEWSNNYQEGYEADEPLEWISMDIDDDEDYLHYYALVVTRVDEETPIGTKLEIYLGGTSEFVPFEDRSSSISTSSGSISEPADAQNVLAVGAIDYIRWQTGPQEEYSSQGPTNDWNGSSARIKPDIMGPDGVTTSTYGDSSFFGTSATAPHVAGIAALALSMNPAMTPDELQGFLVSNAIDMGTTGKDNYYGYGRLQVKDTDNDGIFDGIEDKNGNSIVDPGETDPDNPDTDSDGMPDGWEVQYGLNPLANDANGDLDNDGFSNLKEYQEGTLPNDRTSRPRRGLPWLQLLLGD